MPAATTTPDQQRRRLRVGLVGAGRHAREVIAPALTLAGIEIAGVAARGTSSAANLAELLGNVPAFAGAPAMIASLRGEIDAIVAVLPAGQGEVAISPALEAGLAVYCEKPGALAADELRKLELARAERQGKVMIGYMKRFAPAYRRARDLACEADFGGISALSLQWSMGSLYADADYFLRENAVHMFDLIRFLIGEVTEVHAIRDRSGAGIAIAQALRFEGGAVGTLHFDANGSFDHPAEAVRLTGRSATILVDNLIECHLRRAGQAEQVWRPNQSLPVLQTSSLVTGGFVGALTHFADVVLDGAACESDLASAVKTMELAERTAALI